MSDLKSKKVIGIPDPLASEGEKKDPAYGLKWAIAMQAEWFGGGMINNQCLFTQRHIEIDELRLYVRGEQDLEEDKNHTARQPDDLTLHNLDFTPINYAEKFVNKVANGMGSEFYRVDVRSIDRFSSLEKKKKYDRHKTNMAANPMLKKAAALGLPDLSEKGFVPQDVAELDLYSQIKERPLQEISEEILINFAKKTNRWEQTKKKTDKDSVITGLQVSRIYTDENNGVVPEYVDPGTFIHSFSEMEDFSDAFYFGYVDTITINELRRESGYNDVKCRKIAKLYAGQNKFNETTFDFSHAPMQTILDIKIQILRFTFQSDKKIVFKRYFDKNNKTKKVSLRDNNYVVPEGSESSRLSKSFDTWYEGSYIIGSDEFVYNYQESEILAKDEMNKVFPPFVVQATSIYRNRLRSFLKNIIALCKQLQRIHLKIQHLVAELKPDLIEIDMDQVAELISDAKGNPEENIKKALSYLNVKGIVLKKRVNMGEDGMKDGNAARPMPNQQGSALGVLLNSWSFYYKQIEDITGLDPVGAQSLVGTNQMIQLSNNTATKHIVDASVMFDKRVCETISARTKGIFKFERLRHLRKTLSDAVGRENIEAIKGLENRSLHEFGFTLEMVPAKEELDELREDLGISLKEGSIDVSDKSEILAIARNNMKQARQYMHFVRAKNIKQRMKEKEFVNKTQSKNNIDSAKAKQEGEITVYQQKKMIDIQYDAQKSALVLKELQAKMLIEEPLRQSEFEQAVYLEEIKGLTILKRDEMKEKAKDDRQDVKSSQQSVLIDQRLKDTGSFDFTKPDFNLNELLGVG
jgi:hypothetical protein